MGCKDQTPRPQACGGDELRGCNEAPRIKSRDHYQCNAVI